MIKPKWIATWFENEMPDGYFCSGGIGKDDLTMCIIDGSYYNLEDLAEFLTKKMEGRKNK